MRYHLNMLTYGDFLVYAFPYRRATYPSSASSSSQTDNSSFPESSLTNNPRPTQAASATPSILKLVVCGKKISNECISCRDSDESSPPSPTLTQPVTESQPRNVSVVSSKSSNSKNTETYSFSTPSSREDDQFSTHTPVVENTDTIE